MPGTETFQIEHLEAFRKIAVHRRPGAPIVYLAGDSSLDNKYWVPGSGPGGDPLEVDVPEIYHHFLAAPTPKPDVGMWLNHVLGNRATCINAAVEASTLEERKNDLLPHDEFIRDHITKDDVLVVSVGCNDIAMRPNFSTIWRMLFLAYLTRQSSLEKGTAWCLPYFARLFGNQTQTYVEKLCARAKPRAVILCMIYFPLQAQYSQHGWADYALKALGYDRKPGKLQAAIRQMYRMGTKGVKVEGTEVIPCALYEVLDGTCKEDYVARVEPSSGGGSKMVTHFAKLMEYVL